MKHKQNVNLRYLLFIFALILLQTALYKTTLARNMYPIAPKEKGKDESKKREKTGNQTPPFCNADLIGNWINSSVLVVHGDDERSIIE